MPAYNEQDAIRETVLSIEEVLKGFEHEIIVVDDGSSDDTALMAAKAGAIVIKHPHNLGYGASLKSGIKRTSYDTIVITDADGTYPNEHIPDLLREYKKGYDMVVGARKGNHYWESFVKGSFRLILKWLVEFTTGRKIPDVNSGLRIFSKKEIMPYFNHLCNTFSFTTSLTLAYMMSSKFVHYTPVSYNRRIGKTKVRLFRDMLRTMQYIVQAILYYNPLKLFLLISGFIFSASIFLLVIAFFFKFFSAFYLGIGGMLASIIVFCMGLLADLLMQIMTRGGN